MIYNIIIRLFSWYTARVANKRKHSQAECEEISKRSV
jgi:hypothetical protein